MFGLPQGTGLILLALIVIGVTVYFATAQPPPSSSIGVQVPTKNTLVFTAPKDAADGTLHIHTSKDVLAGADMYLDVRHNGLSESPAQRDARAKAGVDVDYVRYRRFFDPAYDFPFTDWGTFAGARTSVRAAGGSHNVDDYLVYGLRASPARLLYGTIAPDLLLAPHDIGIGISGYAPADLLGARFNHWGLGVGRLWSTAKQGRTSDIVYLSFSTKDL